MKKSIAILTLTVLLTLPSFAQIRITEVLSTGNNQSPYAADWFELTNFGSSAVNISGYKIDDDSASFASSLALNGITSIGAGESVIFLESAAGAAIPAFKSSWFGVSVPPSLQVGYYSGSGIGLGANGDALNLYNSGGTLVNSVSFGAATNDVTFGFNPNTMTFGGLSVSGTNGAFTSPDSEIGSPGAVPEPSTYVLLGAGLVGLIALRRQIRR